MLNSKAAVSFISDKNEKRKGKKAAAKRLFRSFVVESGSSQLVRIAAAAAVAETRPLSSSFCQPR